LLPLKRTIKGLIGDSVDKEYFPIWKLVFIQGQQRQKGGRNAKAAGISCGFCLKKTNSLKTFAQRSERS
jgi:hypothetical protein